MTTKQPRGIRNNNPGNIRRNNDPWQGLAKEQNDREFFTFQSAVYGIRALARLLITYQDKYGLCTIEGIITRWAPAIENNTASYIQAVARNTGFSALQTLDMHRFEHLKPVVEAIIQHENGQQPYSDAEITKALVLASSWSLYTTCSMAGSSRLSCWSYLNRNRSMLLSVPGLWCREWHGCWLEPSCRHRYQMSRVAEPRSK